LRATKCAKMNTVTKIRTFFNELPRRKRTGYQKPTAQGKKNAASGGELNPKEIKL